MDGVEGKIKNYVDGVEAKIKNYEDKLRQMRAISLSSPRTIKAMGELGVTAEEIHKMKCSDFPGNEKERKIQYAFHLDTIISLISQVNEKRTLVNTDTFSEEEQKRMRSIIEAECTKFKQIQERQAKEMRNMFEAQMSDVRSLKKHNFRLKLEREKELRLEEQKKSEEELYRERNKKRTKLRKKAELLERNEAERRAWSAIRKAEECEKHLEKVQRERKNYHFELQEKRIREMKMGESIRKKMKKKLTKMRSNLHKNIMLRYNDESSRYQDIIEAKIRLLKAKHASRRARFKKGQKRKNKMRRNFFRWLKKKHQIEEERLEQARRAAKENLEKRASARSDKLQRILKLNEQRRVAFIKRMELEAAKAEARQARVAAQQAEEARLSKLVAEEKKKKAQAAVERHKRAMDFKREQISEKVEWDEHVRDAERKMTSFLRQKRIANEVEFRRRQEQLRENFERICRKGAPEAVMTKVLADSIPQGPMPNNLKAVALASKYIVPKYATGTENAHHLRTIKIKAQVFQSLPRTL